MIHCNLTEFVAPVLPTGWLAGYLTGWLATLPTSEKYKIKTGILHHKRAGVANQDKEEKKKVVAAENSVWHGGDGW